MTRRNLGVYTKEHFGMDLSEFVKQKVEKESLYDYEIAAILNVNSGLIGQLRKDLGVKRTNGFLRRFDHIYGFGAVSKFKKMIEETENSLSDVARHFGFSREYARQVYEKIYGVTYTEARKRKRLEIKRRNARDQFSEC